MHVSEMDSLTECIAKNPHRKHMNNEWCIRIYMDTPLLTALGLLFLLCTCDLQKTHKFVGNHPITITTTFVSNWSSGAPEFTPAFWRGSCYSIFSFMCMFCTFSSGYCVLCSSSIYGFWLPLWYLKTLLSEKKIEM